MIKMNKRIVIATCTILECLLQCSTPYNEQKEIKVQLLKPKKIISTLNDSIYLSDRINEIISDDSLVVIFDNKRGKTYLLDHNFRIINFISHGKGPSEFLYVYHAFIRNNKIIVADYGKREFYILNKKGDFQKSITSPYTDGFLFKSAANDSCQFYFSSFVSERPIVKIDSSSVILNEFGENLPFKDEKHKRALNNRNLIATENNQLLSIWVSRPIIERYTSDGKLLEKFDLSEFFQFRKKKIQQLISDDPSLEYRMSFKYFNDILYDNHRIYLLYLGNYEIPISNQILVIKNEDKGLEVEKKIDLQMEGAFFKQISIINNTLITYDAAGSEIVLFELGDN